LKVIDTCTVYRSIFSCLDIITSKLRLKYGDPCEADYEALETSLDSLKKLWETTAGLSHTPKFHALLCHAAKQMRFFGGIGDVLEDDVERMHQVAGRFEHRTANVKNPEKRALFHAKMEALSHNKDIITYIAASRNRAKRTFQKPMECTSPKRKKMEREKERVAISAEINANSSVGKLTKTYDTTKSRIVAKQKYKSNSITPC